jgi:hypothetical protein
MPSSPTHSEPDFGNNDVPSIDFDVETSSQPNAEVSGLGLSMDKDDESTLQRSDLGSLELSNLEEDASPKKRKKEVGPKRMKKRRKIVIDNNQTELTSDHMKAMLRDTSDVIMRDRVNIADWDGEDEDEDFLSGRINHLIENVSMERLLARPCLGDDGGLAPELLALWGRNTVKSEFIFWHYSFFCLFI